MTLEAGLPIKKSWVERTVAAKSSVDIDRGWVNPDQSGNTWGSNVQRSIAAFEMLIGYHFPACQKITMAISRTGSQSSQHQSGFIDPISSPTIPSINILLRPDSQLPSSTKYLSNGLYVQSLRCLLVIDVSDSPTYGSVPL